MPFSSLKTWAGCRKLWIDIPGQVGTLVELAIDYVRINSINSFHNCRAKPKIVRSFRSVHFRSVPLVYWLDRSVLWPGRKFNLHNRLVNCFSVLNVSPPYSARLWKLLNTATSLEKCQFYAVPKHFLKNRSKTAAIFCIPIHCSQFPWSSRTLN